jgi:IPT/TIG domain
MAKTADEGQHPDPDPWFQQPRFLFSLIMVLLGITLTFTFLFVSKTHTIVGLQATAHSDPIASLPQAPGPALFFSDLESGPNVGNSDTSAGQTAGQDGAIVTVWGTRLGRSRGDSQLLYDGKPVKTIYYWGAAEQRDYQKVVFQLNRGAKSGPGKITVVVKGSASNALPFTVREGHIYFVALTGKDGNRGTYGSPWRTVLKARNTMRPGDITYAMDGVSQSTEDGEGWAAAFLLRSQWCSASGYPRALAAYPGATVTIGNADRSNPPVGIRSTDFSAGAGTCEGNWVFTGLRFRGLAPVSINGPSRHWRFVGNDISCPKSNGADGGGACFETTLASDVQFYGNTVHDAGTADASALFQGVYFSTDSNHVDMGWNVVSNVHGCRGVQIHSSPLGSGYPRSGYNLYDIRIHDNVIHDTQCDGIILDTLDPSKGAISVYNNVIYNAGQGPNNPERSGGWSCINVHAGTENGDPGSGMVDIYNNTLYSCGTFTKPPYGSANAAVVASATSKVFVRLRNNVVYQVPTPRYPSGVPYVVIWNPKVAHGDAVCAPNDDCPWVSGSNNLFYGEGTMSENPANITGSIDKDPLFADTRQVDFHLRSGSPAAHAGVATPQHTDHDGVPLPQGSSYPIGAYARVP